MFRELRRKKQLLTAEAAAAVLTRGTSGVLALAGDGGYPYAVPISYVYDGNRLYFHCARSGHKLDAIQREERASFCVIDRDDVVPEEYTTYFRSVIAFGRIRILEDEGEKRAAIERPERRERAIQRDWAPLCLLEMSIEHLTGKEAIELVERA